MKTIQTIQFDVDPDAMKLACDSAFGPRRLSHVAREIGISPQLLHYYIGGKRNIPYDTLVKFAAVCRVPLNNLTKNF